MSLTVRPAGPGDVAAVVALEETAFPADPWSVALIEEALAGRLPTTSYVVAERGGDVVGYAVVSVAGEVAELQRIATGDPARRSGVATELLAAAEEIAAAAGAGRLVLEVRETNDAALAFYARAGFTEIARRVRYYRDGTDALVLERPVRMGR